MRVTLARVLLAAAVVVTILFWVVWSWKAAVSIAVILAFLALLAFTTGIGAEWLRGGSRGRFGGGG